MKILCSSWIASRIAPGLFFGAMAALFLLPEWDGDDPWPVGVGFLLAMIGCLAWAANDVVVITGTTIHRGFRSLELSQIRELSLVSVNRFIGPNVASLPGYEIYALTSDGEWRVGLFGVDRGRWGGIDPRIRARLAALRKAILR